jgi:hypothetical protein
VFVGRAGIKKTSSCVRVFSLMRSLLRDVFGSRVQSPGICLFVRALSIVGVWFLFVLRCRGGHDLVLCESLFVHALSIVGI